uniref:Leucine rich repeat containing 43 n=1 Tax=Saimiri boliviensis boliviensis TaxID=39432 RepID=A0A2K6RZV3_SAIBB
MEASSESESEDGPGTQRPGTGTVSAAVREHLRKLCLREFPCGSGSWNKSRFLPQTWRTWRELVPREENVVSPGEETVEALLGLVRSPHSPWALLNDSNSEDSFLRELAIRNPLMIRDTFFYSYFRSLRVVDKEVTLVDKDLLKFLKLEELVLSANRIKEVEAANLPPTLKVLELYGNEISSMECLCAHPPPGLQHLGLGHNKLLGPSESLHITTDHWPNLVSLDLGFNDLTDLQSMLASLRTLRHLRLLVLQGNPLALVPYYRGLTVDSLAQLCVLDDITVSPNEKHLFRGLSLNGGEGASVQGGGGTSPSDPDPSQVHFPGFDSFSVFLQIVKPSPSLELLVEESPEEVIESVIEDVVEEVTEEMEGSLESEVEEWGESEVSIISVPSTVLPTPRASAEELAKLRPRIDPRLCPSPGTVLFNTTHKPWAEVIPCNYEMQHVLRDLVPLKAFLLAGTTVTIVEEKILSWPVALPAVDSPLSAKKGKGEKDKKEKEKDGKGKGEKEPAKQAPKKKKEPPKELRQDPPTLQVLGRGLVVLEPLLVGEPLVSTVCNFGVVRTLASNRLAFARDSKKIKKTAKKEKPKAVIPIDEGDYHPEPLTVEVQIQLNQCRSAEEALRTFAV